MYGHRGDPLLPLHVKIIQLGLGAEDFRAVRAGLALETTFEDGIPQIRTSIGVDAVDPLKVYGFGAVRAVDVFGVQDGHDGSFGGA